MHLDETALGRPWWTVTPALLDAWRYTGGGATSQDASVI